MTSEINRMTRTELIEYIRQMEDEHQTEVWNMTREKANLLLAKNKMNSQWEENERNRLESENAMLRDMVEIKDQNIAEHAGKYTDLEQRYQKKERELDNALRILKERANVAKDVRPKTREGYVIQSFEDWMEKVYDADTDMVLTYKTVLQTYYDHGFDLEVVRDLVREDLIGKILPMMQLPQNVFMDDDYRADPTILTKNNNGKENLIYRLQLKFNAYKGFFEVTLYHTLPLGMIPDDLLPPEGAIKKK